MSPKPQPSNPTLADAFNYYLEAAFVKQPTKDRFSITMEKCRAVGLLDYTLKDLKKGIIRGFLSALSRDLAPQTVWLTYQQLMTACNLYTEDHDLPDVKINGVMRVPRRKDDEQRLEERFSMDDLTEILSLDFKDKGDNRRFTRQEANSRRVRDLWVLMCFTGMSIVDLMEYDGKMENGFIFYRRGKNDQLATVPVFSLSKSIIEKYTWPVRHLSSRTFQHHCTLLSKRIGRKLTPHTARHSCGCILLDLGISLDSVSKILGHSSPLITSQIYAKVSKEKIANETANLTDEAKAKIDSLTQLTQQNTNG